MSKVEKLNQQLKNNNKLFIDVIDPLKREYIDRNLNAEMILQSNSSIMEYYKSFHAKGFNEISIISKRKKGTSYIDKQLPITISFKETIQQSQQQKNNIEELIKLKTINVNIEIQKSVRNLLESEQSINEIKNNLDYIMADWYNPIESEHKNVTWVYKFLTHSLELIKSGAEETNDVITNYFSYHPEDGIDNYIDSLHDLMINWLDTPESSQSSKEHISNFKTYRTLRKFLKELKLVEIEYNKQRELAITN